MQSAALIVEGLSVTYRSRRRKVRALDDVSISVAAGQTVALLGPNGSGKSTLLKAICGMVVPQHGTVNLLGHTQPVAARHLLGVVFQSDSLDPHMSVQENLRDQASLYGVPRSEAAQRIDAALERAGLANRRADLVKTLSRGLARRVDLCRALLHRPRILLLDEPTVGLDPSARSAFLAMLEERQQAEELTIIMSTHLIDEADRMSRVVLLHEGRIVADDSPGELRRGIGSRLVTVEDSTWQPPDDAWKRTAHGWRLALPNDREYAGRVAAKLTSSGAPFSIAPPTLADVFEHYAGRPLEGEGIGSKAA